VTVTDALGRSVRITQPVHRIVALNSDCLEVLRILKAEDRVVGVYSDIVRERSFWGKLADVATVGKWNEVNLEAVAALAPDLVIGYGYNPDQSAEEKLKKLGIVMLRLDFYRIATLEQEVRTLGTILGQEAEAERFVVWHHRYGEMISTAIAASSEEPSVYIENYSDYHASGPGTGGQEMCRLAGGRNIASASAIPFPQVTPEWVLTQDPQVIIKAAAHVDGYSRQDGTPFDQKRDAIAARPSWRHIKAVTAGQVHVIDGSIWTGPRSLIGIAYLARWFHLGLPAIPDPEALHREYLETFQGIPYQGVYVSGDLIRHSE
jgi:iron complex transport system substrate-binding protein